MENPFHILRIAILPWRDSTVGSVAKPDSVNVGMNEAHVRERAAEIPNVVDLRGDEQMKLSTFVSTRFARPISKRKSLDFSLSVIDVKMGGRATAVVFRMIRNAIRTSATGSINRISPLSRVVPSDGLTSGGISATTYFRKWPGTVLLGMSTRMSRPSAEECEQLNHKAGNRSTATEQTNGCAQRVGWASPISLYPLQRLAMSPPGHRPPNGTTCSA